MGPRRLSPLFVLGPWQHAGHARQREAEPWPRVRQYTSIAFTERLAQAGIAPSIGSVADAYDNALAESTIGLFKTELIARHGPWKTFTDVEFATAEWVDWYNHRRLHGALGHTTPAELETAYDRQRTRADEPVSV